VLNAQAQRLLVYPREALFDLAADIESYPQYLPGWISAQIYQRGVDFACAQQVVGFGPVRFPFRSRASLQRPEQIVIASDDPQFRHFRIRWRFDAGAAQRNRVLLAVELELRSRWLQSWLDRLGSAPADDTLLAFEQRARTVLRPSAPTP
jgi:coenzyme Q-binding protein COQ10